MSGIRPKTATPKRCLRQRPPIVGLSLQPHTPDKRLTTAEIVEIPYQIFYVIL